MPITVYKTGPRVARLRLQFMPVSRSYAFTFGDVLIRLHVARETNYTRKEEAIADAAMCGLSVDDEGEVAINRPRISADIARTAIARMSAQTRQDTLAIVAALNIGQESGRTLFESLRRERGWRDSLAGLVADCADGIADNSLNL